MTEDIHDSLQEIFVNWDELCGNKHWSYDIVADEPNRQGFLLLTKSGADEAEKEIRPIAEKLGLNLDVDRENRRGVLFTFSVKSVNESLTVGSKVRWKSANNPSFWGGYVQPGDTGTVLRVREVGPYTSVTVQWDKLIKSNSGKDMHQVTPTDIRDIEIIEEGHWKLLSKKRKREEFSAFANPDDAKKVRQGRALGQKNFKKKLDEALSEAEEYQPSDKELRKRNAQIVIHKLARQLIMQDTSLTQVQALVKASELYKQGIKDLFEDQYKSPNRKMIRKQSMFRSSFGPSKSFGGIKGYGKKVTEAIAGEMVPPQIEKSGNIGVVSAWRTPWPTKDEDPKIKTNRKDLTDAPTTIPQDEEEIEERAISGTSIGRTNEKKTKQLGKSPVPAPDNTTGDPSEKEKVLESQQHWPTFSGSFSQSNRGIARSGLQQRSQFGLPVQQAQDAEEAGNGNIIKQLASYPDRAEVGYEYVVTDAGIPTKFKTKSDAVDYILDHPTAEKAEYKVGNTLRDEAEDIPNAEDVIPDDTVSRVNRDIDGPAQELAAQQDMRPLGLFGPADYRQQNAQPVSNVSVQHPPDRSFDANTPKVTTKRGPALKSVDDLYREFYALLGQG